VQAAPEPSADSKAVPGREGTPLQPDAAVPDLERSLRSATVRRSHEEAHDDVLGLTVLEQLSSSPPSGLASPEEAATSLETAVTATDEGPGEMQSLSELGNTHVLQRTSASGGQASTPEEHDECSAPDQVAAAVLAKRSESASPATGQPTAPAAEGRDAVDDAGSAADNGRADALIKPHPAAEAFAVLCCEVFEPRNGRGEVDRPEVARITENPLFSLAPGRVTDDVPTRPAATPDMPVHIPPDVTASVAALEDQGAGTPLLGGPVPAQQADMQGTCVESALEAATEYESTETAALTGVSRAAEAAEEEPAGEEEQAAEEEAGSDHEKTLRGRQARSVARKIRESWAALQQEQQEQQEQPADNSAHQNSTEPRQMRVSSVHSGKPWSLPIIKDALALSRTPYSDEGETEDITDVIYANWGSVTDTPIISGEPQAGPLQDENQTYATALSRTCPLQDRDGLASYGAATHSCGILTQVDAQWMSLLMMSLAMIEMLCAGVLCKEDAADRQLSLRCAELERALKVAALKVTDLEGDAIAAASHISILQAEKAALTAK
jgi:hypothetical protein